MDSKSSANDQKPTKIDFIFQNLFLHFFSIILKIVISDNPFIIIFTTLLTLLTNFIQCLNFISLLNEVSSKREIFLLDHHPTIYKKILNRRTIKTPNR